MEERVDCLQPAACSSGLKALEKIKVDKKRKLLPEAAGVWHGKVYDTMFVMEAAGGYMDQLGN